MAATPFYERMRLYCTHHLFMNSRLRVGKAKRQWRNGSRDYCGGDAHGVLKPTGRRALAVLGFSGFATWKPIANRSLPLNYAQPVIT